MFEIFENREFWIELIEKHPLIAPLIGVFLVFLKSIIPIIPLFLFVAINIYAFGFIGGYFLSLLGSVLGSFTVFKIFKYIASKSRYQPNHKIKQFLNWFKQKEGKTIFILICIPFAPASLINIVSGLTKVNDKVFLTYLIAGKAIMLIFWMFFAFGISKIFENPIYFIGAIFILIVGYFTSKKILI